MGHGVGATGRHRCRTVLAAEHWYQSGDAGRALAAAVTAGRVALEIEATHEAFCSGAAPWSCGPTRIGPRPVAGLTRDDVLVHAAEALMFNDDWEGLLRLLDADQGRSREMSPVRRLWEQLDSLLCPVAAESRSGLSRGRRRTCPRPLGLCRPDPAGTGVLVLAVLGPVLRRRDGASPNAAAHTTGSTQSAAAPVSRHRFGSPDAMSSRVTSTWRSAGWSDSWTP